MWEASPTPMILIATIATIAALLLSLPLAVLAIECWLSLLPLRRQRLSSEPSIPFRIAVVIPAHDEADLIAAAVERIKRLVPDGTRVVVIADNCTDATAENALSAGAVVWRRDDPERRGKGYALNFAWEHLADSPPDVVVCIDADCVPGVECIATIARLAYERRRPVQAGYTMYAPSGTSGLAHVSALAVYVKNVVRPRGLQWLRLPCLLTGSGMAFPWEALSVVRHPGAHLVEDMRACTDFAIAGFPPMPCMEVGVTSPLPTKRSGFMSQRTRWEHGHMRTILSEAPRLLARFLLTGSLSLLAIALELAVPPLSFLVGVSTLGALLFAVVGFATTNWWPLVYLASASAAAALGIGLVWIRSGREILPGKMIIAEIPRYISVKAPMYFRFLSRPQTDWVRTERAQPLAASPDGIPSPHSRSFASAETAKRSSTDK
jgi:cellulose synthase/poly-beta-1,6-N-acetylglucosamine synthase-like glycosyltransferase